MNSYQQLSGTKQILLNVLPIPSAFISILASMAIIYLALQRRKVKPWTPYIRLLVAMSVFDISFSINVAFGTFLRPKETSKRLWAFGNDTSCNFVAFVNQASWSGLWYQGMLSIYFLLTARYGMKNKQIAKFIEPLMHLWALGYSFGGAIFGLLTGIYGEKTGGAHCWIARFYEGDGVSAAERKKRDMIYFLMYPIPVALVTICLICTQLSVFFFVRQYTRRNLPSKQGQQENTPGNHQETSLGWSERTMLETSSRTLSTCENSSHQEQKADAAATENSTNTASKQSQRLRLVCSQAFLFVFSFFMCNIANVFMATRQTRAPNREAEMATIVQYYPVAIVQAILLPIQGLFNFLIYIRPKYLMLKVEFPREGRVWAVKRIFLGQKLPPTKVGGSKVDTDVHVADDGKNDGDIPIGDTKSSSRSGMSPSRFRRNMISSVTASDGDFDSLIDELQDERWQDASNRTSQSTPSALASGVNRLTNLEAISEMSASVFETIPTQSDTSSGDERSGNGLGIEKRNLFGVDSILGVPRRKYGSNLVLDNSRKKSDDAPIRVPRRVASEVQPDDSPNLPTKLDASKVSDDVPIRTPRRTTSEAETDSPQLSEGLDSSPAKRKSDVPVELPLRFLSSSASEIEDA